MVLPFRVALIDYDPNQYTFFGFMGVTSSLVFCNLGASYGTAKSGVGICSVGVLRPELVFRSLIPIIMAGILGIYGLIVAVILQGKSKLIIIPTMADTNCFISQHHVSGRHSDLPMELQRLRWLQAPRLWSVLRPLIAGSWSGHRCDR